MNPVLSPIATVQKHVAIFCDILKQFIQSKIIKSHRLSVLFHSFYGHVLIFSVLFHSFYGHVLIFLFCLILWPRINILSFVSLILWPCINILSFVSLILWPCINTFEHHLISFLPSEFRLNESGPLQQEENITSIM